MPSTIRGSDNLDSAYAAALKAWVNFNGTGTVAIRGSLNVSSITDNGTGDYTINFTNALGDANYAAMVNGHNGNGASGTGFATVYGTAGNGYTSLTTTSARVLTSATNGALLDWVAVTAAFFR